MVLRVSSTPKVSFLQSDRVIKACANLEFVVLDWYSDAFLAEDTPKFIYDVVNGSLMTS